MFIMKLGDEERQQFLPHTTGILDILRLKAIYAYKNLQQRDITFEFVDESTSNPIDNEFTLQALLDVTKPIENIITFRLLIMQRGIVNLITTFV